MHGCCSGPFKAQGHSCTQLPERLAHTGPLQGVSALSQRYHPPPHSCSWPQNEHQKECSHPFSTNCVFGGSFGFRSNAGRLTPARISSLNACLARFKLEHHVSVSTCRRLLGLMATSSHVLPLGLLHMRPFLWWMRQLSIRSTGPATRLIRVSRSCFRTLLIWRDPTFLWSGVRIGYRYTHMVTTDASMTGWGTVFEGRPAHSVWTGEFLSLHINCLELRVVFLALIHFLPLLRSF